MWTSLCTSLAAAYAEVAEHTSAAAAKKTRATSSTPPATVTSPSFRRRRPVREELEGEFPEGNDGERLSRVISSPNTFAAEVVGGFLSP